MTRLIAMALLGLVACAPATPAPSDSAAPAASVTDTDMTRISGTVRSVGSAPMNVQVVMEAEDGSRIRLEGELNREFARLSGAEVEVSGTVNDGAMQVADYRVLAVDGIPVVMGTVEAAPGGGLQLRTPEGGVVALEGPTDALRVGQKVWVQGPVRVQSYGVIRP